jgi:hypothetical protein
MRRLSIALLTTALGCGAILDVSDPEIVPLPLEAGANDASHDGGSSVPVDAGKTDAASPTDATTDAPVSSDAGSECTIDSALHPAGTVSPSNPCQSCQPSISATLWSNSPDGTSCAIGFPPKVCHGGACDIGCFIDGAFRDPGSYDPGDPCHFCAPGISTTSWNAAAEGGPGGCTAGSVCHNGACAPGCGVPTFQAPDAINPNDPCQKCDTSKTTSGWSSLIDGTPCGSGQTCASGQCGTQCVIGGSTYAPGEHNPVNPCQTCQPGTSPSAWTNVTCGQGQTCEAGTGNCVCNATSCPNGCCSGGPGGTCQEYASESGASCGAAGATCAACGNGLCDKTNGTCACNANTCAGGCCNGGISGSCLALASETSSACGTNGATCTGCSAACVQGACAACAPSSTQCSGAQVQTCTSGGTWGAATNCPANQTCSGNSCKVQCTKTVTTTLNVVNPYGATLLISYAMVGGGGGLASYGGGGGGGSSAIVLDTTLYDFAPGGAGGDNGQTEIGTLSLGASSTIHVFVGGGGGSAGANAGGGGGSGYYGGGGGGLSTGGGGGTNAGGGAGTGCTPAATAGYSQHGGDGACGASYSGKGGAGGTGGATGSGNGSGGGGGFGGGGGGGNTNGAGPNDGTGGSNGANGGNSVNGGGLGSNNWASATTLPTAAGQGGIYGTRGGGNGGLVILTYASPTGACSL